MTRSRMHLASMPAATTAVPQPIRPFKRAGVQHTNPKDSIATYSEGRAAYNRHTGVLLSLDGELLHAFREAEASGTVVQAPRHPEDRAVLATRRVARRSGAVCMLHGIPALFMKTIWALCAHLATYSGASLFRSLAVD